MLTKLYVKAANLFAEVKNDERGVTAIEYGLIAVAMAVLLGAVFATGNDTLLGKLDAAFDAITAAIGKLTTSAS